MAIEKHDFRKYEAGKFFAARLDRPICVEIAGELRVSARAVLICDLTRIAILRTTMTAADQSGHRSPTADFRSRSESRHRGRRPEGPGRAICGTCSQRWPRHTSSKSFANFDGSMTDFMGIVLACLRDAGHDPIAINELTDALQGIARNRPDLVERYGEALASRKAGEIESLWSECVLTLSAWGNIRINGVTGRLHIGHSSRSYPLFPPVFQIWPPHGAR